jgi:pimeloyl-ACP methyl ester carboxylesterase
MISPLRRRYIRCGARRVHLWTGGAGPALVLIHGSPGNAWLIQPLAERLAAHFTVYAVDTPGFGASDPLPGATLTVAQLADAYREILDAIGLERATVYGTHSGAAFGLELARRHPSRVSGFVLDGVPAFTEEEIQPLFAPEYMVPLEPDLLGGHYARAWTRFHDQFVWFPWYQRDPAHLNESDSGTAADIHLWVEMYFQALRHEYRPAYRAAIGYGAAALAAAAEVGAPGVYMAVRSDMLFPHLDRLPPLADGQRIERVMDPRDVPARTEAALRSLPPAPPGVALAGHRPGMEWGFHDLKLGQMFVRDAGSGPATPVLLLHDAPGAGRQLAELHAALSAHGRVLLPDLPGCGDSDPPSGEAPGLSAWADALAELLAARDLPRVNVYGVGFGAAVALELNARHPDRVGVLCATGLLRSGAAERRALIGRLAPPISLADDGSHWYRVWLMLRDSLVRWPWFARDPGSLRRQPLVFDADHLHAWTCDVMRQWNSYHLLIDAVLEWSPLAAIDAAHRKLVVAVDPLGALHGADAGWASSQLSSVILPPDAAARAAVLASHWAERGIP